jgi:hypothetical protein
MNTENATSVTATSVTDTSATPPPSPSPKAAPPRDAFAYQGLPAKFELPDGVRSQSFSEQLLSPERPQTITLVLLSMTLVTWVAVALALIAAWMLWRERAAIRESVRARLAEAAPVAPVVA